MNLLANVAGLHIGAVEASSAVEIKILLDVDAPQDLALNTGQPTGFPRVNGYVLVPNEGGTVVAQIGRMTMEPEPAPPTRNRDGLAHPVSRRRLFVTPIGTLQTRRGRPDGRTVYRLRRGVASFPSVGDSVILPNGEQLRAVVEASGDDCRVQIGTSPLASDAPVTIDPDKLFGRHLGVFGNTGSGKSCSVSGLIRWSIEAASQMTKTRGTDTKKVSARFIVLDPNGEYRTCFNDLSDKVEVKVFSAEPDEENNETQLVVPAWMWNGEEWASAVDAAPGSQRPVLMNSLRQLRAASLGKIGSSGPESILVLASNVRAFHDYLSACRAQGVQAIGVFPRYNEVRSNLESLSQQLQTASTELDDGLSELIRSFTSTAKLIDGIIELRTNGRYSQPFHDNDIVRIIEALAETLEHLPASSIETQATEDTPIRFDPQALPGAVKLQANLMPGNMLQHMAGLDLRLRSLLGDSRIVPMIAPEDGGPDFGDWLVNIFGSGADGQGQITVIDLSLVPSDVLSTVVSVLARLIFETAQRVRHQTRDTLPTVLVLEEAHNFVQRTGPDSNDTAKTLRCRDIFEKIAKEGRKFGVGLTLSSQRPAELAPTIVAQCNSFILHRIVNDRDQDLVSRLAPDSSGSLLKELPSLPTQKAILMGIAAEIPLVFDVRPLPEEHRPNSAHPDFWGVWTHERQTAINLKEISDQWRS